MATIKDLIDRVLEGLAGILAPAPEPVPVRVRPAPNRRPRR